MGRRRSGREEDGYLCVRAHVCVGVLKYIQKFMFCQTCITIHIKLLKICKDAGLAKHQTFRNMD